MAKKNKTESDTPEDHRIGANGKVARVEKEKLKAFIERVERLEEEKKATADEIKEVFAEAKSYGYDVKAMRTVIRERKQDGDEIALQEQICDVYRLALGMI